MCNSLKIFSSQIKPKTVQFCSPEFRPNRGTVSQILTLRRLIEGIKEKNLPAVLTFVDFRRAFDSIHREKMLQILLAYGIPPLIVNAIGVMYKNTTARVKSPDGDTDFFPILAGVLQGDTLAPFLFIVTLDYAMRKAMNNAEHLGFTLEQRQSKRYPARTLTDTDFADDIALLSDNIAHAEVLLHKVESAAKEIGLTINSQETEYMSFNNPQGNLVDTSGAPLSQVTDFQYLGSIISWVESTKKDVEVRIAKAWAACSKLNNMWQSDLSKDLKINLFRAAVESVLLYGSESWTMTDTLSKRIYGTYTRLLRTALNVSSGSGRGCA